MDGVSLTTQNYAYWLNKKAGNVCVVTPNAPGIKDETEYPVYRYSSIPIPMRKPYRLGFPRIDWPFHEKINKLSFSLVHAHCPFSSGNLAMCIARTQGIPVVATFHSKYRKDFERSIPNKRLVDFLVRNIVSFYESADEVWVPQPAVEETLREYGYKGRVEVVDNGSDYAGRENVDEIRAQSRQLLGIAPDQFVLLFVGQHIWEKNLSFLVDSLSSMRQLPFQMFFIGTGYADRELRRKVAELNLGGKVKFVGSLTDRSELERYYASADLFLFPSLYDNAPLVVREAAALRTPSVLIKGSTSAEIVVDGENGFLTDYSVDAFAGKISRLMLERDLIRSVGAKASYTIARSWQDVTDEVYDRYLSLMTRKLCV
jgi:glycosyltransferase involved in cell wall biosynthesis